MKRARMIAAFLSLIGGMSLFFVALAAPKTANADECSTTQILPRCLPEAACDTVHRCVYDCCIRLMTQEPVLDHCMSYCSGNLLGFVGGIAQLPDMAQAPATQSSPSDPPYAALAGGLGAAALALSAGAWYARRRWIR